MNVNKLDFFEDIAVQMDSWVEGVSNAMTKSDSDLVWVEDKAPYQRIQNLIASSEVGECDVKMVLAECFRGIIVSVLTALDGGTALAEKGRVYLVDEDGNRLGEGLHDDFVGHLLDSGRFK